MKNRWGQLISRLFFPLASFFIGTSLVLAAGGNKFAPNAPFPHDSPPPASGPVTSIGGTLSILVAIVDLAQAVFWIATAGFGLYAAFLYLTAGGNKESVATARRMFINAIIAALLAIIAYGIPGIVADFLNF